MNTLYTQTCDEAGYYEGLRRYDPLDTFLAFCDALPEPTKVKLGPLTVEAWIYDNGF